MGMPLDKPITTNYDGLSISNYPRFKTVHGSCTLKFVPH